MIDLVNDEMDGYDEKIVGLGKELGAWELFARVFACVYITGWRKVYSGLNN